MTIYHKIEDEFSVARGAKTDTSSSPTAEDDVLERILADHPELSAAERTNIRLYFNSKRTLEGLAEWVNS